MFFVLLLTACKTEKEEKPKGTAPVTVAAPKDSAPDRSRQLIARAIDTHGGNLYHTAHYGFTFREKQYAFSNKNGNFTYTLEETKDGKTIKDVLKNGKLTRYIDGSAVTLSKKDEATYSEALNSVIYFATLPHKLGDSSVISAYRGQTEIKGQVYDAVEVRFQQEGGGTDHDDVFLYWFNAQSGTMDYLAYQYHTNGGGVRFRSAYNPRTVDGIRFQDYINYKAEIGTPLDQLPELFEKNALEELSRIETEDVVNLNKQ